MGVFNTMALNQLGVDAQTRSPRADLEKEDGIPTGYMEERAFLEYQDKVPSHRPRRS